VRRVSSIARTIYSGALLRWLRVLMLPPIAAVPCAPGGVRTQSETMWEWPFRLLLG
jgi:hypothetical protein